MQIVDGGSGSHYDLVSRVVADSGAKSLPTRQLQELPLLSRHARIREDGLAGFGGFAVKR